uniref:Uncharacterized protein n=1 Tax=Anguilla anguilla TaxID=7936 RepID=A0A0E9W481_ANGAN
MSVNISAVPSRSPAHSPIETFFLLKCGTPGPCRAFWDLWLNVPKGHKVLTHCTCLCDIVSSALYRFGSLQCVCPCLDTQLALHFHSTTPNNQIPIVFFFY